ncbi:MAG TPA: histidine kinase [Terriglobales bacterium]|nr:histidine kinase [Terriglobales bacterium]
MILYGVIFLVSHMLDSRERLAHQQTETARLNEQLSKAQLNALRRQIEPHFLFITLNAIAGLVHEKGNDAAVNMIAGLSVLVDQTTLDGVEVINAAIPLQGRAVSLRFGRISLFRPRHSRSWC